jgi:hypothetical protein
MYQLWVLVATSHSLLYHQIHEGLIFDPPPALVQILHRILVHTDTPGEDKHSACLVVVSPELM